ncbi:hypothetical protein IW262DRAFT_1462835 [Armillaria fumosa]|nr:hypothetical protein IW262DRAFT_1462835 [Armillaria fumosa]
MSLPPAPKDISAHPQKGSFVDPADKAANVDRKSDDASVKTVVSMISRQIRIDPPSCRKRPVPINSRLTVDHLPLPSTSLTATPSTPRPPTDSPPFHTRLSIISAHITSVDLPPDYTRIHPPTSLRTLSRPRAVLSSEHSTFYAPVRSARTTPRVASARALLHLARAYCLCEMVSAKRALLAFWDVPLPS